MNCKMRCLKVVAMCLATILLQTFSGAQTPAGFSDVPENHWARPSVERIAQAGFIEGDPQDHFRGNSAMTRYEFVVALSRLINGFAVCVPPSGIDTRIFATKTDVNQVLERLTAIENRLSELEKKVAVAPAALATSELSALHLEVKTAVAQTNNLVKCVED